MKEPQRTNRDKHNRNATLKNKNATVPEALVQLMLAERFCKSSVTLSSGEWTFLICSEFPVCIFLTIVYHPPRC
jgi:hypothetical protein